MAGRKRKPMRMEADSREGVKKLRRGFESEEGDYSTGQPDSLFRNMLREAGYILGEQGKPHHLKEDQAVFQQNLTRLLKRDVEYPRNLPEFICSIQDFLSESSQLQSVLLPTQTASDCTAARSGVQDSLLHLLLNIADLQPGLLEVLLEKLTEIALTDSVAMETEERNLPFLIVSQLRWLHRIVDGDKLMDKIVDLLQVAPVKVQQEVITCIPEIMGDDLHQRAAICLSELLQEKQELTTVIVDALSNMNLKPRLQTKVRNTVMKTVASVSLSVLPVVVKFVLQSVGQVEALEVVVLLRESLDLTPIPEPGAWRDAGPATDWKDDTSNKVLVLENIRLALTLNKSLADAWIKTIEAVTVRSEQTVMDLLVLLLLHGCASRRRLVESLCRSKIRHGFFTEATLQSAFSLHAMVLKQYFTSIMQVANALIRSQEPSVSYFSSCLYKQAFLTLDGYCRQQVVADLITYIGSGEQDAIVKTALALLSQLVHRHTAHMASYAVYIAGLLDHVDSMDLAQARQVMGLLSVLAYTGAEQGCSIQNDIHIVITKQLSNTTVRYKRMGVIGAVMAIGSMARRQEQGDNDAIFSGGNTQLSDDSLPAGPVKQAGNLLELVRSSTKSVPEAAALFMDEIAALISHGSLDTRLQAWIRDGMTEDFQDDFVIDVEADSQPDEEYLPISLQYGLDGDVIGGIAINLAPLVIQSVLAKTMKSARKQKSRYPILLTPQFRLLRMCETSTSGGNLENIDALLGCPIYLPTEETVQKFESLSSSEQHVVCTTLFFCLNWFREVVNAFATQADQDIRSKVLVRLKNIVTLQRVLGRCLATVPKFVPPPAQFSTDAESVATGSRMARCQEGRAAKEMKQGRGKSKCDVSQSQMGLLSTNKDTHPTESSSSQVQPGQGTSINAHLLPFRPYFRELDMDVFTLLSCHHLDVTHTDRSTEGEAALKLAPSQLEFLLEDLVFKLDHSLTSSPAKKLFLLNRRPSKLGASANLDALLPADIAEKAAVLLKPLCTILETLCEYFQNLVGDSGIVEDAGALSRDCHLLISDYCLCFRALNIIFSWRGFQSHSHRRLLKAGVCVLASRINSDSATQASLEELHQEAFCYVQKFAGSIITTGCAVNHLKLLKTLFSFTVRQSQRTALAQCAKGYLQRVWHSGGSSLEDGTQFKEHVEVILQTYLSCSGDVLRAVETVAAEACKVSTASGSEAAASESLPTLSRQTFAVYFRSLLTSLTEAVKTFSGTSSRGISEEQQLQKWDTSVRLLHTLISVIRGNSSHPNLRVVLKNSRQFVELFLKYGMPLLDRVFQSHQDSTLALLKCMQLSTRYLQHICSHSKVLQDVSLTKQVPFLKKMLEMFVYRVKAMLALNKCSEAFWMGNLKNRNLQGEEIISQTSQLEEEEMEARTEEDSCGVEVEDGGEGAEGNRAVSETTEAAPFSDDESLSPLF